VTAGEAVNEALQRLVQEERQKRLKALESLQRMADEGAFDVSALDKGRVGNRPPDVEASGISG
jgi:hypothetical protein